MIIWLRKMKYRLMMDNAMEILQFKGDIKAAIEKNTRILEMLTNNLPDETLIHICTTYLATCHVADGNITTAIEIMEALKLSDEGLIALHHFGLALFYNTEGRREDFFRKKAMFEQLTSKGLTKYKPESLSRLSEILSFHEAVNQGDYEAPLAFIKRVFCEADSFFGLALCVDEMARLYEKHNKEGNHAACIKFLASMDFDYDVVRKAKKLNITEAPDIYTLFTPEEAAAAKKQYNKLVDRKLFFQRAKRKFVRGFLVYIGLFIVILMLLLLLSRCAYS